MQSSDVFFEPAVRIPLDPGQAYGRLARLAAVLAHRDLAEASARFAACHDAGAGWARNALEILDAARARDETGMAAAVRAGAELPMTQRNILIYHLARTAGTDERDQPGAKPAAARAGRPNR